ncbi:hypothetical protein B5807_10578 [Epicoccum nigrum]|uniref:Apple domain-containing protein n=1 Tax=Epicoccum nigrum TaxID=105696 RepID=A0A1Y2LLK2_EPING|nr:hypothetical protein B5807_10578 [Epicoccum nigrum]
MIAGHASLHDDAAYVTYEEMETYDAGACARRCDEEKTCASFNIYFQRRPTQVPGTACPNPDATVAVHCALFGEPINISKATNNGQIRGPANGTGDFFEVRVAGSNGI